MLILKAAFYPTPMWLAQTWVQILKTCWVFGRARWRVAWSWIMWHGGGWRGRVCAFCRQQGPSSSAENTTQDQWHQKQGKDARGFPKHGELFVIWVRIVQNEGSPWIRLAVALLMELLATCRHECKQIGLFFKLLLFRTWLS